MPTNWKSDTGLAWFYLVIAFVWGLSIIVVTPPFQTADEPAHFYRAWSVANLQVLAHPDATVSVPENVVTLPERLGSGVGGNWASNEYSVGRAVRMLWEPISKTTREQATSAASYPAVGYLPQATGIEIARVQGHPLLALYLGRIGNLVAAVVLVFFAIRIAPFGKPLLALVALLPMFVFQTAGLSPDVLVLSGCLLFLALVLRYAREDRLNRRELGLLAVVGVLL